MEIPSHTKTQESWKFKKRDDYYKDLERERERHSQTARIKVLKCFWKYELYVPAGTCMSALSMRGEWKGNPAGTEPMSVGQSMWTNTSRLQTWGWAMKIRVLTVLKMRIIQKLSNNAIKLK